VQSHELLGKVYRLGDGRCWSVTAVAGPRGGDLINFRRLAVETAPEVSLREKDDEDTGGVQPLIRVTWNTVREAVNIGLIEEV
jgi:hypothetical protein